MRVLLPLMLLAPLALAAHTPIGDCDGSDNPALGLVQVGEGGDAYYVDDRGEGVPAVYHESNGVWSQGDVAHSLQRGASSPHVPRAATCVDDPRVVPDERIL